MKAPTWLVSIGLVPLAVSPRPDSTHMRKLSRHPPPVPYMSSRPGPECGASGAHAMSVALPVKRERSWIQGRLPLCKLPKMAAMAGRGLAARGEEREQRPAAAAEEDERTVGRPRW